ncbi:MAG: PspC domain-containing protein [Opitutales bacterium]
MSDFQTNASSGLYRARNGLIFGVCKGLAKWRDLPVWAIRLLFILFFFVGGFFPAILFYVAAAIIMKPEPVIPFGSSEDREFYDSYTNSREMALNRLKRTFEQLDRRTRRLETIITDRENDWERRFGKMR